MNTVSPLISAADLAARVQAGNVRLVDCSHDLADPTAGWHAYAEAHLPGAVHAHLDRDLSGPATGTNGRHPLPDPAAFVAWLQRLGLREDDDVVAYDRSGGMYAARLWWLLRWVGHGRVQVLDGGFPAWTALGLPVEARLHTWPASMRSPARADARLHVALADVERNLSTREALLVDARGTGRYAGQGETIDPRAGHIPGAANRPYLDNLDAQGRFKPAAQLREEWLRLLDGRPPSQVVAQCGSGVTACHNLLAMALAGLPGARLYPGSWSEWCSDLARPIATGAA